MFVSVKIKPIIAFLCIIVLSFVISFSIVSIKDISAEGDYKYTIVLDAGHGGVDGGCVGVNTGVKESDLNLEMVKILEKYFTDFGFKTILTRKTSGGLYDSYSDNFKIEDMEKRKSIIENSRPNLIISIHMNSWPSSEQYGSQVYYQENNAESKTLADTIQTELINNVERARGFANMGDYYILKCSQTPTALVECGYLSNPEDEAMLVTKEFQEKLSYHIFCGVVRYLKVVG